MLPTAYVHLISFNSVDTSQTPDIHEECTSQSDSNTIPCLFPMQAAQLHTQLLLLDYKQFKAARTIQSNFRGFNVRIKLRREQEAAAIIQNSWHRYIGRRYLILLAQERAQQSIQILYYNASLKIQSFFRGWWSRKHVNNLLFLKNMQLQCVEELLHSYAKNLHTMMRTGELPGFMDFNKDKDNFKVKDILTTLAYRFYNRYVGNKYMTSRSETKARRREFMHAVLRTWVPYSGVNHNAACQKWTDNFDIVPKVYELREYDVAQMFIKQTGLKILQKEVVRANEKEVLERKMKNNMKIQAFCKDVANSMRFWRACRICEGKVKNNLFNENFKNYLADVKFELEAIHFVANCNCTRDNKQNELLKCPSHTSLP
ncbi:uncharacterized protein LOC111593666 [Drosophila hydei]|uniref:Uncharacterized protein LOC111593666 n=1 Tax=Drosophila hydei TaxID=7224 RepID=A0A6J1L8W6_DROHY|nr:uncharacterized protein LOC111593666 [Drosophila hydei]